jgi:hypothetical protein
MRSHVECGFNDGRVPVAAPKGRTHLTRIPGHPRRRLVLIGEPSVDGRYVHKAGDSHSYGSPVEELRAHPLLDFLRLVEGHDGADGEIDLAG